jgi:sodium-dependent dicarboxylate transporter 2/3/5
MSLVFLFLSWFVLTYLIFPLPAITPFSGKSFIKQELKKLGPISLEEKRVRLVFFSAAFLWMTRWVPGVQSCVAFGVCDG